MPSVLAYKVAIIVLLAAASGSTAGVTYYYQGRASNLASQVANLSNQSDSQNGQINSLKSQIDNLTRQITQLQNIESQLITQISRLREQLANTALCSSGKTITIGELLDLSDGLSTVGMRARDSSALAISDMNSMLSSTGCNLKFATIVDDYAHDNAKALTDLQSLAASGVQVVVGPLNSAAAQYILSFANANHIVLISPSSSSPALAIPNDYLFRTAPNDAAQGFPDARMLWDRGAKALIIIERHDAFGDGLANATATRFKALGGTVIDTVPYDQSATDFTVPLTNLFNDYQSANVTYPNKVAIYAVSFEELGQIILETHQQHPSLLNGKLPWFGTDGDAQDPVISSGAWGSYVAQVQLPSTLYYVPNNPKMVDLFSRFATAYPGEVCDVYCAGAYDDVWLAALATLQAGSYDGTKIQAVMLTVASNFYGATGWMELQPSGDRAFAAYQIWKVVPQGSPAVPTWVLAGAWDPFTDAISWTSPP